MATLHQATEGTKTVLTVLGISVGSILLLVFIYRLYQTYRIQHSPPPPPTMSYGKLSPISFPQSTIQNPLQYTVDTVSGFLPDFSDREPVYKIVQPQPDLNALTTIENSLRGTEFDNQQPIALNETLYMWTTSTPPFKKLTIDKLYHDFSLTSGYTTDISVLKANPLGDEYGAKNLAIQFFKQLSSYPNTIDESKTKVTYFAIKNGTITAVEKIDTAQIFRIDFYYKDLAGYQKNETLPVYYPHSPNSIFNAIVGSNGNGQQLLEMHYIPKDLESTSSTYPIKTTQEAFDELQNRKAYIISYYGTDTSIPITDVSLGYYMDESRQEYVKPIIIFQGKNGFLAFIDAVKDLPINTPSAAK